MPRSAPLDRRGLKGPRICDNRPSTPPCPIQPHLLGGGRIRCLRTSPTHARFLPRVGESTAYMPRAGQILSGKYPQGLPCPPANGWLGRYEVRQTSGRNAALSPKSVRHTAHEGDGTNVTKLPNATGHGKALKGQRRESAIDPTTVKVLKGIEYLDGAIKRNRLCDSPWARHFAARALAAGAK